MRDETQGKSMRTRVTYDDELEDKSEPWGPGLVLKGSEFVKPKSRPALTPAGKQLLSRARSWSKEVKGSEGEQVEARGEEGTPPAAY